MVAVGETLPNQNSSPWLWDLEFVPLEQFRVEPITMEAQLQEAKAISLSLYLDGYFIRERQPCDCPIFELMTSGCQCGGR